MKPRPARLSARSAAKLKENQMKISKFLSGAIAVAGLSFGAQVANADLLAFRNKEIIIFSEINFVFTFLGLGW